ncbi:MAG TPA: trypsin-like peptidase domain-containing protein [Gemmataceae bacterium]|jgi:S1-C subfamily serine protease|nr:trypsin-like peptidase domain-containing protein [Gemmataceae bacterium]
MKRLQSILLFGVCALVGGAAVFVIGPHWQTPAGAQTTLSHPGSLASSSDILKIADRFEAVARLVSPSVVYVEATKPGGAAAPGKSRSVEESGSGVVIRVPSQRSSLVLTNNHVISQASPDQIAVNLADGRLLRPGRIWTDPESDVAILRLDGVDNLPSAVLGDSDKARVGQWVLAIGSPFGLNQTVTHGIVSARERGQISLGNTIRIKDFLQTDAAINPGSSGGPLVNLDGEVIGINTAIASHNGSNSGVAFSIPINLVKRVMTQLLEKGSVSRGYLGMQLADSFEPTTALKLGLDRVQGALVETVYPDTPASAAGLRANDVVLKLDGDSIRNENHLINMISVQPAGKKVRLQVWRERRTVALEATVGDWTQGQTRFRP